MAVSPLPARPIPSVNQLFFPCDLGIPFHFFFHTQYLCLMLKKEKKCRNRRTFTLSDSLFFHTQYLCFMLKKVKNALKQFRRRPLGRFPAFLSINSLLPVIREVHYIVFSHTSYLALHFSGPCILD